MSESSLMVCVKRYYIIEAPTVQKDISEEATVYCFCMHLSNTYIIVMDKIKHDDIHERRVKLSAALKQVIMQTGQYAA